MRYLRTGFLTLVMLFGMSAGVSAQEGDRSMVSFHNDRVFVGIRNHFGVVAQQLGPVRLDQLSAVLLTYGEEEEPPPISLKIQQDGNRFTIRPEQVGIVNFTIQLADRQERYSFHTKQLDTVARIGGKTGGLVPAIVLKAQRGVYAIVEGYDYCGSCKIISYEIIRITSDHHAEFVVNQGSNWEPETAELISKAQSGDRYIFDKIVYRCPGNTENQLAETLSFELK
jgi:hypothetical protein